MALPSTPSHRPLEIADGLPRVRLPVRWIGWLGIGLLVLPALALGMLVLLQQQDDVAAGWMTWLGLAGMLALAASGVAAALVLVRLRGVGEIGSLLCGNGADPVFVKDRASRYRYTNGAASGLLGLGPADLIGRTDSELIDDQEAAAYEENDRVCLRRGLPTLFRETRSVKGLGTRSFLVSKYPLHDVRGRVSGLLGTARDITDELALQDLTRCRADETRAWFDANPLPVVIFAASDLRILRANLAAERCYQRSAAELARMSVRELFADAEGDRLDAYLSRTARAAPLGTLAWRQRRADGTSLDVLTDIANLPHAQPPVRVLLVRDVSAEVQARAELGIAKQRLGDLLDSGLAMVWMHDLDAQLTEVNGEAARALDYEPADMIGRRLSDFIAPESQSDFNDYLDRVRCLQRDAGVLHVVARSGERRVWQYRFTCYPNATPAPYVLVCAQDVTLRHRQEARLREATQRDALTGCRARRYLDAIAWRSEPDTRWGCIVVDVDDFRQINATEGRERGDALLRELAALLGNVAAANEAVVRLGGDQFAVLLERADDNAVRERVAPLARAARDGMPVPFSIGWALREGDEAIEATLRRADKMLARERARAHHEASR